MRLLGWLADWWEAWRREASIPAPPFEACKRTAEIMYGVWFGRLTPAEAREKAAGWGFTPERIEDMISKATQPPSYWSKHPQPGTAVTEPGEQGSAAPEPHRERI